MGLLDNLNFSQPFRISSLLPSEAQLQAYKQKSDAEALAQFSQDPNPIRRVPFNILTALGVNPTIAQAAPTTLDVAPVTGEISALADARTAFGQGDLATAGLLSVLAAAPFVPAGKVKGLLKRDRTEEIAKLRAEANAQRFGDEVDTTYRMQHQANPDGARLDDMTGGGEVFPDDIYSSDGLRFYGNPNNVFDRESFDIIQSVRGKPDAEVTIYRAVPNDDKINTINRGDFVTLSPTYAELHGASGYGRSGQDAGKVISQKVKVKDLRSDGNDLNEFGYFPEE